MSQSNYKDNIKKMLDQAIQKADEKAKESRGVPTATPKPSNGTDFTSTPSSSTKTGVSYSNNASLDDVSSSTGVSRGRSVLGKSISNPTEKGISNRKFNGTSFTETLNKGGNISRWDKYKNNLGIGEEESNSDFSALDANTQQLIRSGSVDKRRINISNINSKYYDATTDNAVKAYNARISSGRDRNTNTIGGGSYMPTTYNERIGNVVQVNPDGTAPEGTAIGDTVVTAKGAYKVLGQDEYGWITDANKSSVQAINDIPNLNTLNQAQKQGISIPKDSVFYVEDEDKTYKIAKVYSDGSFELAEMSNVGKNHAETIRVSDSVNPQFNTQEYKGEYDDPMITKYKTVELSDSQIKENEYYADQERIKAEGDAIWLNADKQRSGNVNQGVLAQIDNIKKDTSLIAADGTTLGLSEQQKKAERLTPEQKRQYNYFCTTQGTTFANKWLDAVDYDNKKKRSEGESEFQIKQANADPIGASLNTVLMNLTSGVAFLGNELQGVKNKLGLGDYKPVNQYNDLNTTTRVSSEIRSTVRNNINNPVLRFGYDAVMSMADMGMASVTFGSLGSLGSKFATIALSTTSGNAAIVDSLDKGASQSQALWNGLINGTLEFISESPAVEGMFKIAKGIKAPTNLKTFGANLLRQSTTEGLGEIFAQVTQTAADQIILGDKSDFALAQQQYMAQGYTESQANNKAFFDLYCKESLYAFLQGFAVGGVMGAGANVVGNRVNGNKIIADEEYAKDLSNTANSIEVKGKFKETADALVDPNKTVSVTDASNLKNYVQNHFIDEADNNKDGIYAFVGLEYTEPSRLATAMRTATGREDNTFSNKKFTRAWNEKSFDVMQKAERYATLPETSEKQALKAELERYMDYADTLLWSNKLSEDGKMSAIARETVNEALNGIKASAAGTNIQTENPSKVVQPEETTNDTVQNTQDTAQPTVQTEPTMATQTMGEPVVQSGTVNINDNPVPISETPTTEATSEPQISTMSDETTVGKPTAQTTYNTSDMGDMDSSDNEKESRVIKTGKSNPAVKRSVDTFNTGHKSGHVVTYHKSAISNNGSVNELNAEKLIDDKSFDIIIENTKDNTVTFVYTKNFDGATEPLVTKKLKVKLRSDGVAKVYSIPVKRDEIIVDKSRYVPMNYKGFDVKKQRAREDKWKNSGIVYNPARLNNLDYFKNTFGKILMDDKSKNKPAKNVDEIDVEELDLIDKEFIGYILEHPIKATEDLKAKFKEWEAYSDGENILFITDVDSFTVGNTVYKPQSVHTVYHDLVDNYPLAFLSVKDRPVSKNPSNVQMIETIISAINNISPMDVDLGKYQGTKEITDESNNEYIEEEREETPRTEAVNQEDEIRAEESEDEQIEETEPESRISSSDSNSSLLIIKEFCDKVADEDLNFYFVRNGVEEDPEDENFTWMYDSRMEQLAQNLINESESEEMLNIWDEVNNLDLSEPESKSYYYLGICAICDKLDSGAYYDVKSKIETKYDPKVFTANILDAIKSSDVKTQSTSKPTSVNTVTREEAMQWIKDHPNATEEEYNAWLREYFTKKKNETSKGESEVKAEKPETERPKVEPVEEITDDSNDLIRYLRLAPRGVNWKDAETFTGGKYRSANNYEYNKVQFAAKDSTLYAKLFGTNKNNPVKQVFFEIPNYKNTKPNQIELFMLESDKFSNNADPLGRHFHEGLLKFYHDNNLGLGFAEPITRPYTPTEIVKPADETKPATTETPNVNSEASATSKRLSDATGIPETVIAKYFNDNPNATPSEMAQWMKETSIEYHKQKSSGDGTKQFSNKVDTSILDLDFEALAREAISIKDYYIELYKQQIADKSKKEIELYDEDDIDILSKLMYESFREELGLNKEDTDVQGNDNQLHEGSQSEGIPEDEEERNSGNDGGASELESEEEVRRHQEGSDDRGDGNRGVAEKPRPTESGKTDKQVGNDSEGTGERQSGETDNFGRYYIDPRVNPFKVNDVKRAENNIEAIKTLKTIQNEERKATLKEKEILSKFTGWGGLSAIFKGDVDDKFKSVRKDLIDLVGKTAFNHMMITTGDAYYTPYDVISGIYSVANQLGIPNNTKVLEQSCGSGFFLGMMPENMREKASVYAVERDKTSGEITQALYDDLSVMIGDYSDFRTGNIGLIVGNVPYGTDEYKFDGASYKVHDYFIIKGLSELRSGGIMAVLTSHNTLDKADSSARKKMAEIGNLVGAIRLPNNTFNGTNVVADLLIFQKKGDGVNDTYAKDFVNTELVDGINKNTYFVSHPEMILGTETKVKKRFKDQNDDNAYEFTVKSNGSNINSVLKFLPSGIVSEALHNNAQDLEDESMNTFVHSRKKNSDNPDSSLPEYSIRVRDGKIVQKDDKDNWSEWKPSMKSVKPEKVMELFKDAEDLLNAKEDLITLQLESDDMELIKSEIKALEKKYDAFVEKHGYINKTTNKRALKDDSALWSKLSILENYKKEKVADGVKSDGSKKTKVVETITKSDVLLKPTIKRNVVLDRVENAHDALMQCLNITGQLDLGYICTLTNKPLDLVVEELGDAIYEVPTIYDEVNYELAFNYLSGDVVKKLAMAKEVIIVRQMNGLPYEHLQRNVDALEAVIPPWIPKEDVNYTLGASWISPFALKRYVLDNGGRMYGYGRHDGRADSGFIYTESTGAWTIDSIEIPSKWKTERVDSARIFDAALNNKEIVVRDKVGDDYVVNQDATTEARVKIEELKNDFQFYMEENADKIEVGAGITLIQKYNREFNSYVNPKYDGSHLKFAGMNTGYELYPHQKNAVYRVLSERNTLLQHDVGVGKTNAMIASAMEMKRLGIAQRPLFVVQATKVADFVKETLELYPNARVLALESVSPENRKKMLAQMQAGEFDIIITSYDQFKSIPFNEEYVDYYIEEQTNQFADDLRTLEMTDASYGTIENLRKKYGSYKKNLEKLCGKKSNKSDKETESEKENKRKNDEIGIYFEELGIDALFVDECQAFKNLYFPTSLKGGQNDVKNVPQSQTALAIKMHMATEILNFGYKGKGQGKVIMASATPETNSLAEAYVFQKYLQPEVLREKKITAFDAWVKQFGTIETVDTLNNVGTEYISKRVFSKFQNVPELSSLLRRVVDFVDRQMAGLKLPKEKMITRVIQSNNLTNQVMRACDAKLFLPIPDTKKDGSPITPRDAAMIQGGQTYKAARLAATDIRFVYKQMIECGMISPDTPIEALDFPDSKVNTMVKDVLEVYKRTDKEKGTQLIFCENGVNYKEEGVFNFYLYGDIKKKLIAGGIPENEIAFIQDYKDLADKAALSAKVNAGEIRVVLGGSGNLGTGQNMQKKLKAVHNLDLPQVPADLKQRLGRHIRQGNGYGEVETYYYTTANTKDAEHLRTLLDRTRNIDLLMKGEFDGRTLGDLDVENEMDNLSLETVNNPILYQLKLVTKEYDKLIAKVRNETTQQQSRDLIINQYPQKKLINEEIKRASEEALEKLKSYKGVAYTVGDKKEFENITSAGLEFYNAYMKIPLAQRFDKHTLGTINGFDIVAYTDSTHETGSVFLVDMPDIPWIKPISYSMLKKDGTVINGSKNVFNPQNIFMMLTARLKEEKGNAKIKECITTLEDLKHNYEQAKSVANTLDELNKKLNETRAEKNRLEEEKKKMNLLPKMKYIERIEKEHFNDPVESLVNMTAGISDIALGKVEVEESIKEQAKAKAREIVATAQRNNERQESKVAKPKPRASTDTSRPTNSIGNFVEQGTGNNSKLNEVLADISKKQIKSATDLASIVKEIAVSFRINLITAKRRMGKTTMGFFEPAHNLIHLRNYNDLGTVCHELGHKIDNTTMLSDYDAVEEMYENAPNIKDTLELAGYNKSVVNKETFAEFVWQYLNNPDGAYRMGSYAKGENFYDTFERVLEKNDLLDKVQNVRNKIIAFSNKSNVERVSSSIKHRSDKRHNDNPTRNISTLEQARRYIRTAVESKFAMAKEIDKRVEEIRVTDAKKLGEEGRPLTADESVTAAAMMNGRNGAVIEMLIGNKFIKPDGSSIEGTKGFFNIIEDFVKDAKHSKIKDDRGKAGYFDDLETYLFARHSVDWENRKKFTINDNIFSGGTNTTNEAHEANILGYKSVLAELEGKYGNLIKNTANEITSWWNMFMDEWAVRTGLMERDLFDHLRNLNPHYVPLFRVMDKQFKSSNDSNKYFDSVFKQSKKIGSKRDVYSPIENFQILIKNIVNKYYQQNLVQTIAAHYNSDNENVRNFMAQYIIERSPNVEVHTFDMKSLKDKLKDQILADRLAELSPATIAKIEAMTPDEQAMIYAELSKTDIVDAVINDFVTDFNTTARGLPDNVIVGKVNGQTKYYEIVEPALIPVFMSTNKRSFGLLARTLGAWTRFWKSLTTASNFFFAMPNALRDTFHAWINIDMNYNNKALQLMDIANLGFFPSYFKSLVVSLSEEFGIPEIKLFNRLGIKHSELYQEFKAGNGYALKHSVNQDTLSREIKKNYNHMTRSGFLNFVEFIFKAIPKLAHNTVSVTENATRYTAYKRSAQWKGYKSEKERRFAANMAARDVTVNFDDVGELTSKANFFIVYLNAYQSAVRQVKEIFTDKKSYTTVKGGQKLARLIAIPALAALLQLLHIRGLDDEDQEEYASMSSYVKNKYWVVKFGDKWWKIAKEYEFTSLFGTTTQELFMASVLPDIEDAYGWKDVIGNLVDVYTPSLKTAFGGISDAMSNKAWYGGRIVSSYWDDALLPDYYQYVYDERTSSIAQLIAKGMAKLPDEWQEKMYTLSTPKGIDYALDQSFGFVADLILPNFTESKKIRGDNFFENIAGVFKTAMASKFKVDEHKSNQYISDYHDIYARLKAADALGNPNKDDTDDGAWLELFNNTVEKKVSANKETDQYGINDYYNLISQYNADDSMSFEEKQEKIDECYDRIGEMAKELVTAYNSGVLPQESSFATMVLPESAKQIGLTEETYKPVYEAPQQYKSSNGQFLSILRSGALTQEQIDAISSGYVGESYTHAQRNWYVTKKRNAWSNAINSGITSDMCDQLDLIKGGYDADNTGALNAKELANACLAVTNGDETLARALFAITDSQKNYPY